MRKSLQAFIEGDAELARSILTMDDAVDAMNRAAYKSLTDVMEEQSHLASQALNALMISRALERVADHATTALHNGGWEIESSLTLDQQIVTSVVLSGGGVLSGRRLRGRSFRPGHRLTFPSPATTEVPTRPPRKRPRRYAPTT